MDRPFFAFSPVVHVNFHLFAYLSVFSPSPDNSLVGVRSGLSVSSGPFPFPPPYLLLVQFRQAAMRFFSSSSAARFAPGERLGGSKSFFLLGESTAPGEGNPFARSPQHS